MTSAFAPCLDCDQSSHRCGGCHQVFCDNHFLEHQQNLDREFDNLTNECSNLRQMLTLPPSYESITENSELLNQVNQWELDTIRQVKEIAEQTREKIRQRSDVIPSVQFGPEFQQLNDDIRRSRQPDNRNELEMRRLTTRLTDLKLKVENVFSKPAELRITPIDWSVALQLILQQNIPQLNPRTLHFERLSTAMPRTTLDVKRVDWHTLGTASPVKSAFLHYENTKKNKYVSVVTSLGQQKQISWYNDQSVWDSCWSTFLNKFIILADNRLYTYDDDIATSDSMKCIEAVKPKRNKMEFLRCACSNECIFITYDERNSSVDEYNMRQWTVVHRYENIVKENEIIISIAMSETNRNLIGMTVLDDRQHWHFELRNQSMQMISSIQLDSSEFNRRLISLSNPSSFNWLVIHTGSSHLTAIDESAQTKRTIECAECIDLATYFPTKNCLVLLTQKNKLKFFDL